MDEMGPGSEMEVPSRCFERLDNQDRTAQHSGKRQIADDTVLQYLLDCPPTTLIANHEVATRGRVADEAARVEWTRWELWPNSVASGPRAQSGSQNSKQKRSLYCR
jgi:hypothetical protein